MRNELEGHSGSYDTFIFSLDDNKIKGNILEILKKLNFGTKNLPDMEWHCSYFWEHALSEKTSQILYQHDLLKKQIAIPILLRKSLAEYDFLPKQ